MEKRSDTSMRVNAKRKTELQKKAIKLSYEIGIQVRMSELVNHLIDNYLEAAAEDIKKGRNVSK